MGPSGGGDLVGGEQHRMLANDLGCVHSKGEEGSMVFLYCVIFRKAGRGHSLSSLRSLRKLWHQIGREGLRVQRFGRE